MNRISTSQSLTSKILGAASALSMCAVFGVVSEARAEPPQIRLGAERVTAVEMTTYHESRIVRTRSPGKSAVTFSAMDESIDAKAEVVFEIRSEAGDEATPRWRCVARSNVNECFDKPVRVEYRDGDERVVMNVRVQKRLARAPFFANR